MYSIKRQYDEAVIEGEKAITIQPNFPVGYFVLGHALLYRGNSDKAIEMFKKAIRLMPNWPHLKSHLGMAYFGSGKYAESIALVKMHLQEYPDDIFWHVYLTSAYILSGMEEDSRRQAKEIIRIDPNFTVDNFAPIIPYKKQSDTDRILNALKKAGFEMKCPKCNSENRETAKFCGKCRAKLLPICPNCGTENPFDNIFCDECGHDLRESNKEQPIDYSKPNSHTPKHLADKILTTRSSLEGERKIVTVLFADVANYTSMSEKLDPEDVLRIMDGAFKIMMDETHKYEGTINQFTGDGIMSIFGAPVAHENHAQRACYAALSIQSAMEGYSAKINHTYGCDFKIRIGINSGPVIVSAIGDDLRMDYTAVGDTTNLSARIQQASTPGQVWVSRETRNTIKDYFHLNPMGEITMKGKTEPQKIFQVISERTGVRTRFDAGLVRGITDLVGRRPEMEILRSAFEKAKSRNGQVIDVLGEAGVGKSRLVYEFRNIVGKEVEFISGICIQHGRNINFLPIADILRNVFKIEEGITEKEAGDRIEKKVPQSLSEMISFYRSLLSLKVEAPHFIALNPEGRKFGTFEAVKELLLEISNEKSLVLFLDDVQWMDKITEEFFAYLSRCILGHKVLMIAAYRPGGSPMWSQGTHYQRLGLEPLSSKSSVKLVRNVLGGVALEPDLEQKIVEKTEGNPFFVEEILRELVERGDLVKIDEQYVCKVPLDQCDIPKTIQGVLAARMDRLSEDLKRTMQVASVIGKDFAFRLLKSIMELGEELRTRLNNLVGLEILYEKALYPELEYIFKHALTQEVAYESMLKERRRNIHGRIAGAIEDLYADQLEEHYEILAHHYERSENVNKAVQYLMLAGEKSNQNSASQAAFEFFSKVFKLAENAGITLEPETQALAHYGMGRASYDIDDFDTAMSQFSKGVETSRRHGFIEYEMDNLAELGIIMWFAPIKAMGEKIVTFFKNSIERAKDVGDKITESKLLAMKGLYIQIVGKRYPGPEIYKGYEIVLEGERIAKETGDMGAVFV